MFLLAASSTPWWVALLGPVIAATGAWVGIILKAKYDQRLKMTQAEVDAEQIALNEKRREAMSDYIQLYNELHNVCQNNLEPLDARRIVIYYTENGGGIPRPGCLLYSTIYVDAFDPPLKGLSSWQKQPMKGYICNILSSCIAEGSTHIHMDSLPEKARYADDKIIELYKVNNVRTVFHSYLYGTEKRSLFLGVHYTTQTNLEDKEIRSKLLMLQIHVTSILKKMEELYKLFEPTVFTESK